MIFGAVKPEQASEVFNVKVSELTIQWLTFLSAVVSSQPPPPPSILEEKWNEWIHERIEMVKKLKERESQYLSDTACLSIYIQQAEQMMTNKNQSEEHREEQEESMPMPTQNNYYGTVNHFEGASIQGDVVSGDKITNITNPISEPQNPSENSYEQKLYDLFPDFKKHAEYLKAKGYYKTSGENLEWVHGGNVLLAGYFGMIQDKPGTTRFMWAEIERAFNTKHLAQQWSDYETMRKCKTPKHEKYDKELRALVEGNIS